MRIVAGRHRGLTLKAPSGTGTRPTADRVREAIFSSIQMRLPGARVLDAFAGTGAMGLEALSRGAREAVFCEQSSAAVKVLRSNIERADEGGQSILLRGDLVNLLASGRVQGPFDIIFLDPPYRAGLYEVVLDRINDGHFLAKDGLIVAESAKKALFSVNDKVFLVYKRKSYGDTTITYLIPHN